MRKLFLLSLPLILIGFFLSFSPSKVFAADSVVTLGQGGFTHINADYWQDNNDGTFAWSSTFKNAFDLNYAPLGFFASQTLNLPVSAIHSFTLNWQTPYAWFGLRVCPVYTDQTEACTDFWQATRPSSGDILSILDSSKTIDYIKFTNAYHNSLSRNGIYGPITLTYDSAYTLPGTTPSIAPIPTPSPAPYTLTLGKGGFSHVNADFWKDNNDGTFYFSNTNNVFDVNFNPTGYFSTGILNIPVSDISTLGAIQQTQYAWFGFQACIEYTDASEHCSTNFDWQTPIIVNLSSLLDIGKTIQTIRISPAYTPEWSPYGIYGPFTLTFVSGFMPNVAPSLQTISNATITEGSVYATTSSFADTDSTSWTATVDYGDGSGAQNLSLNSNKTFSLSHVYKDEGTYATIVTVTDNQGATGTTSSLVTVTNAPIIVHAINAPTIPIQVGNSITTSSSFIDPGILDTHTASWSWGDGTTAVGTIAESNGSGTVSDSHTYTQAGVYTLTLTVTDDDGAVVSSVPFQYVVVYDPSAGFITGAGKIDSLTGADSAAPTAIGDAHFGIHAKYTSGSTAPTGTTKFDFKKGGIEFDSTSYDWLVVNGNKAYLHGSGTINDKGSYNFLATMIDGEPTTFRMKIKDNATNTIIYDTQMGASDFTDPTQVIDLGQTKIH